VCLDNNIGIDGLKDFHLRVECIFSSPTLYEKQTDDGDEAGTQHGLRKRRIELHGDKAGDQDNR
jgi:hypothetical protein